MTYIDMKERMQEMAQTEGMQIEPRSLPEIYVQNVKG
jgi:hypothetical protein